MTKIKASGIPFCGSYRDAIAEKEYNIAQCQDYILVLEADNKMLRKALQDIVDNEVGIEINHEYVQIINRRLGSHGVCDLDLL